MIIFDLLVQIAAVISLFSDSVCWARISLVCTFISADRFNSGLSLCCSLHCQCVCVSSVNVSRV